MILNYGQPVVTLLNVDTGDIQSQDDIVEQRATLSQRAKVRNESGVDYSCYLANIELLGVVRAHYLWCVMSE